MKIRLAKKIMNAPSMFRPTSPYWMDKVLDYFGRVRRDHRITKAISVISKNRWYEDIQHQGKGIFLGYFNIKEDAIKARIDAEKLYFKEFKSKILNNEVS